MDLSNGICEYYDSTSGPSLEDTSGNVTRIAQKFFGTAAPGSVTGNLPGDTFSDTTNYDDYWCNAVAGTAPPACTSVTPGGWTLLNGGGGGLADPGANGVMTRTATNVTAPADAAAIAKPTAASVVGGTSDAITITLVPALAAQTQSGTRLSFIPVANNTTTTPTAIVSGLTPLTIKKQSSSGLVPLAVGDIVGAQTARLELGNIGAGAYWVLTNPQTSGGAPAFNTITSGTNNSMAGVLGTGSSINVAATTASAYGTNNANGFYITSFTTNASTPPVVAYTACETADGSAIICGANVKSHFLGVATVVTASGYTKLAARNTVATVTFDAATTAGHWGVTSGTSGEVTDSGSVTYPTCGNQVVGYILSTLGSTGTGNIFVKPEVLVPCGITGQVMQATSPTAIGLASNIAVPAGSTIGSLDTGTPNFLFSTNTITANQPLYNTSPVFATPSLGAGRATSLIASGIVDGAAPVTITTGASCTLGTASGCNSIAYSSGYTFNQESTPSAAVTYTLPTAAAGLQYCVANSYNGSNPTTGSLSIQTSASGQYIIFTDGTLSASGGYVSSGVGAAADAACVVGVDSAHWQLYANRGAWVKH
jgi:hypothetical protein